MRRGVATVGIFVAGGLVASTASATESTIYPGVGIGKIRLGMTQGQVERVLGKDFLVNARTTNYRELGWDFSTWTVSFVGKRVVQVATTLQSQKTSKGVGPWTRWRVLVRAYPHGLCTHFIDWNRMRGYAEYLVPHKGGTQTIYILPQPRPHFGSTETPPWRVSEVHVRTRFKPLPEFAPKYQGRCSAGWQNRDYP